MFALIEQKFQCDELLNSYQTFNSASTITNGTTMLVARCSSRLRNSRNRCRQPIFAMQLVSVKPPFNRYEAIAFFVLIFELNALRFGSIRTRNRNEHKTTLVMACGWCIFMVFLPLSLPLSLYVHANTNDVIEILQELVNNESKAALITSELTCFYLNYNQQRQSSRTVYSWRGYEVFSKEKEHTPNSYSNKFSLRSFCAM